MIKFDEIRFSEADKAAADASWQRVTDAIEAATWRGRARRFLRWLAGLV